MPNHIKHDAWIRTRELTNNLDDQRLIRHEIEEALKQKMRYNKQVVSRDKLLFLKNNRIGTTRIENIAKQIEHGRKRNANTVVYIIENNLKRINNEIRELKHTIFKNDKNIKKHLGSEWRRQLYKDLCYSVITPLWKSDREESRRSKDYLVNKYKNNTKGQQVVKEGSIEVVIKPDLSEEQRSNFISELNDPVSMGVDLDDNEKAFLKLPQSLTNHSTFNKLKMFTDVALMGSKIRMTVKSRIDEGITEEEVNQRTSEEKRSDAIETALKTRVYDPENKIASFSNMRVTSLKTCRRVKIPDPLPEKEEAAIQSVITAVETAINREAQRNSKMRTKVSTLTKQEALGLKRLKQRTKKGEAAIVLTDKSGRLAVMSKEHYDRKVSEHTGDDPIVTQNDVAELEHVLSATSSSIARVLRLAETWNQSDRVQSAVKATNSNVPPLAILLKDHKPGEDKPVRPLCRSTESPNGPLSNLTAQVMNIVASELNTVSKTEVKSTEEMCAVLDGVNNLISEDLSCLQQCGEIQQSELAQHMKKEHPDHLPAVTVGSMDVKALYPSLDIDHSCEVIRQLIDQSEVTFEVDNTYLSLHIAATHTQDEINKLGLSEVVHSRRYKNGPRPTIISKSVTGTQSEREGSDSWIQPIRDPTPVESKAMLAIAISSSVKVVMRSNVYQNSDVIRLQQLGMAIGCTATAEVAKLVMLEHDRLLWNKCAEAGLMKLASGRYVDDENPVMVPVPFGARIIEDKVTIVQSLIQADKEVSHDKRTFNLVQQVANSIWPNIQFTVDVPSENPSGLIPMLDMEVGISQTGMVIRQFYTKPMNTPFTILSRSAHSWQIKRSTLTQEGVRRLLNTSRDAPPNIKNKILSDWDNKMNVSGYTQSFRTHVIQAAVLIYTHKVATDEAGGRPLYRPTGWQSNERNTDKLVKKQTWYNGNSKERNQAPLMIDPTPSGQLEKEITQILKEAARLTGIRVKMCQRGGMKVSSSAHADPFASKLCSRPDCPVCQSPDSKGGCRNSNIGYVISCKPCSDQGISATYQGETSKSAYERGLQHLEGLSKKVDDAPIWRHSQLIHDSDPNLPFSMSVTGRFQKAMIRQEDEAIRIRESEAVHQLNSRKEFHQPTIIRLVPVSNLQQSDQTGQPPQIMFPSIKRKTTASSRVDSPHVPERSRPRFIDINTTHKEAPQYDFQPVTTTRRERQDLLMHQAVSRSVMRDYPSTVAKNNLDRINYRSPSVNKHYKQVASISRRRSVSPVQHKTHKHQSPKKHVSREHHRQHKQPHIAKSATKSSKPSYYVKEHDDKQHTRSSSSYSPKPPSYKKQKIQKKISSSRVTNQHVSSNRATTKTHSSHIQNNELDLSPVSPESLSFSLRKARGETQGAIPLSLSPVSPIRMSQYFNKTFSTHTSNASTNSFHEEDEDMFSQMSQTPFPQSTQPTVKPITPKHTSTTKQISTFNTVKTRVPVSSIPNVFNCSKEVSLIRGEKEKNPNLTTISESSDDIPLLENINSSEIYSKEDIESLNTEFDNSWSESNSSPPKTTQTTHNTTTTHNTITESQVLYALQHPITNIQDYNKLKVKRLARAKNLKSKVAIVQKKVNPQPSKKFTTSSKKRTPRKTNNPIKSYFEG